MEKYKLEDDYKKLISALIDDAVNHIFADAQDKLGITSGDILPEQELKLDEVKEQLSKVITEIVEFELETNGLR